MQRNVQTKFLLDDRHQHVDADGDPDLRPHSVLGSAVDAKLLGATEAARPVIAAVSIDDAMEGLPRQEVHGLREQGLAEVHGDSGVAKPGTLAHTAISDSQVGDTLCHPESRAAIGLLTNPSQVNRTVLIRE